MNPIKRLLKVKYPIIQAPMAGAQNSTLAIQVSKFGALGSLPCATLDIEEMRREIKKIKLATDHSFNLNFFCHENPNNTKNENQWRQIIEKYYQEFNVEFKISSSISRLPFNENIIPVLNEFKPIVVSFHFGLPSKEIVKELKRMNIRIMSSATTVEEALYLEENGVDIIIAQGIEAGGHRGMFLSNDISTQMGLFSLLPQIVKKVKVPVVAAGGIVDAQTVTAAFQLGASGVQCGTVFLTCQESTVKYKQLLTDVSLPTAVTNIFTGRPARSIVNRAMKEIGTISEYAPPFPKSTNYFTPLRNHLERELNFDFSQLWSGQNRTNCKLDSTSHEILQDLIQGIP
ncbi:predicted protein [Naegleria gruberi]|uniref:Predicted protein n=1 Tax=Naegleria gruberi TaxID=5762 RepID=D2W136_NAEGR|nr:uncharacterized protein NAEGRDRAFT_75075 [Naegleria gruberi]EFC37293.1 predicted protein [Naegleria gruberi]|eukprot:XP_002670037.1 predicted protein [Naegleria gruberi strain NEG-M]